MNRKPDWFKGVIKGGLFDKAAHRQISPPTVITADGELLDWHFEHDGIGVEKISVENVQSGQPPLVSVSIRHGFDIDDVVMALTQVIYDLNEYHV